MSALRSIARTAVLSIPLLLPVSCNKNKGGETVPPAPVAAADDAPVGGGEGNTTVRTPIPAEQKINVVASIRNLDDIFEAIRKITESYSPESASDPKATLQAQLLAVGFGPGFMGNIDFEGLHVIETSFPAQGQGGPEDASFAGSVAVKDGRKVIESTPSAFRPAPLGEGMWEVSQEEVRMLIKEAGNELHIGMTVEDLDRAAQLRGKVAPDGRRLNVRASNLPADDIDPADLFDLPDIKIVRDFTKVLQDLDTLELQAELGTAKDFELITSASAPFHKLGLEPLGEPRTEPTKVESVLPSGPVFVTTLAYGQPDMLHKMLDASVPSAPGPLGDMAKRALDSAHGLLDEVSNDVVFGLYVNGKGKGTVVIAAEVKDADKTMASLREMFAVAEEAVKMQGTIVGDDKDRKLTSSFKKASVKLSGGVKGDKFSLTVPKAFEEDIDDVQLFVNKKAIDITTMAKDGIAVVAIGAGGRDIAAKVAQKIGKPSKDSLADDAGLAAVRRVMGGCQVCVTGGPSEYARFRLLLVKGSAADKEQAKRADENLKELTKLGRLGLLGAGVKVERDRASFGTVVPQSLLYADPAAVESFMAIAEFMNDPEAAMRPKPEPRTGKKPVVGGKSRAGRRVDAAKKE